MRLLYLQFFLRIPYCNVLLVSTPSPSPELKRNRQKASFLYPGLYISPDHVFGLLLLQARDLLNELLSQVEFVQQSFF